MGAMSVIERLPRTLTDVTLAMHPTDEQTRSSLIEIEPGGLQGTRSIRLGGGGSSAFSFRVDVP